MLLQKAGINTVGQLTGRGPDRLYFELLDIKKQCQIAGRAPTYQAVSGWIAHARELRDTSQV